MKIKLAIIVHCIMHFEQQQQTGIKKMSISGQVEQALIADGWNCGFAGVYVKRIENFAPGGMLSNGARVVTLRFTPNARFIERVDGWGIPERRIDLNTFDDAATAIRAVLS